MTPFRHALAAVALLSATAAASDYEKAVLAKKPVGYWRLGEGHGPIVADHSGHGHKATAFGAPLFKQKGALVGDKDTAVRFDGLKSYIEAPAAKAFSQPTSGKGLSVEVWVRPDALTFPGETKEQYVHWLGKGEEGRQEWAMRFYSRASEDRPNRISAYLFNPQGGLGAGAYFQDQLKAGEWMHVVATFDPGDAKDKKAGARIYKNGVLRQGPPSSGALYDNPKWKIHPKAGTAPVRFATRDKASFFKGALDEVAIYPRVLTPQEVAANYKAGKS